MIQSQVLELTHANSRARALKSHLVLKRSQALWTVFGLSRLGEEDRQEDLYPGLFKFIYCLDLVER